MTATITLVAILRISLGGSIGGNPYTTGVDACRGPCPRGDLHPRTIGRRGPRYPGRLAHLPSIRTLSEALFVTRASILEYAGRHQRRTDVGAIRNCYHGYPADPGDEA